MYWTVHLYGGPRRVNHAAVAIGDIIFTFGGYCSGIDYNTFKPIDIHVLDTVKLNWLKLSLKNQDSESIPFQRYGHTAVAHGSKIYLWGGRNDREACNTLYCFDTENKKWSTPDVFGNKPVPRDGHSACIINNCMYIFGGFQEQPSEFARDLYMLDLRSMIWNIVKTQGRSPSFRDFHTATAIDNKMYIFGGRGDRHAPRQTDSEVYCSNIYYLDTLTKTWTRPKVYGQIPPGRRSHSAFVYNGFLYIFGGFNRIMDSHYQDINRYDPKTSSWLTILPKGISPCARRRQICLVIKDRVFISGGTSPIFRTTVPSRLLDYDLNREEICHLKDHDDLHVLNMNPTLKDICLVELWKDMDKNNIKIDDLCVPLSIKEDLAVFNPTEVREVNIVSQSYDEDFPQL